MRHDPVHALTSVFFKVRTRQIDRLFVGFAVLGLHHEGELSALHDRKFELTDLIALRQIGIKIVLAVKNGLFRHFRPDRQSEAHRFFHGALIQNRQSPGQRQINVAGVRIGFSAERGACPGKNLGVG